MKTVETICTLSELITSHLSELLDAISKLPPLLQNTYAVTSAEILLDFQHERLPEIAALPALWVGAPESFQ